MVQHIEILLCALHDRVVFLIFEAKRHSYFSVQGFIPKRGS